MVGVDFWEEHIDEKKKKRIKFLLVVKKLFSVEQPKQLFLLLNLQTPCEERHPDGCWIWLPELRPESYQLRKAAEGSRWHRGREGAA